MNEQLRELITRLDLTIKEIDDAIVSIIVNRYCKASEVETGKKLVSKIIEDMSFITYEQFRIDYIDDLYDYFRENNEYFAICFPDMVED